MRLKCLALLLFLMMCWQLPAQKKVNKPAVKRLPQKKEFNIGIGAGLTNSVVYLPRNNSNAKGATGKSIMLCYDRHNFLRFTLEYNQFNSPDFAPTWYSVKASCVESNVQFITRFVNGHGYLYPLTGLSYNMFSGYFTGKNDYLNLRSIHQESTTVSSNWLGLNVGIGYDYNFKNSAFYLLYKMRIGYTEGYNQLNIQDIGVSAGYRIYIREANLKKFFLGPRSRYAVPKPKTRKVEKNNSKHTTKPNQ